MSKSLNLDFSEYYENLSLPSKVLFDKNRSYLQTYPVFVFQQLPDNLRCSASIDASRFAVVSFCQFLTENNLSISSVSAFEGSSCLN